MPRPRISVKRKPRYAVTWTGNEPEPKCDRCGKNDKVTSAPWMERWCDRCKYGWMGPA